jgi:hypothetical protein
MPQLLREEGMLRGAGKKDHSGSATSRHKCRRAQAFVQHFSRVCRGWLRFSLSNFSSQTNAPFVRQFTAQLRVALHVPDLI